MDGSLRVLDLQADILEQRDQIIYNPNRVKSIVGKHGFDTVGWGSESVVVLPKRPLKKWWNWLNRVNGSPTEVVFALDYAQIRTVEEAKILYYTHGIMSRLFPHNFPPFRTVYGAHDKNGALSGSVRVKVPPIILGGRNYDYLDRKAKYPFRNVIEAIETYNMPICFDVFEGNFCLSNDGGVYYLDNIVLLNRKPWGKYGITRWMQELDYPPHAISTVTKHIERLNKI